MRVEAKKVKNGFLIPMIGEFQNIKKSKVMLEIEIIDQNQSDEGYAALDQLIGICDSGKTDASIRHDEVIYRRREEK